jgi:SPP1 family phage portal protein
LGVKLEAYDVTVVDGEKDLDLSKELHGRRQIFTSEKEITRENVISVLQKALSVHEKNRREIMYLLDYERGIQPILQRTKVYNDHVNNKVVVNIANEIITFKSSEFAGEPIQYVSRRGNNGVDDPNRDIPKKVSQINDMMLSEGKQTLDLELAHKMFTCGTAYRLTYHDDEKAKPADTLDETPFEIAVPDVENTFVVYRNDVKKTPVMGVTYVYKDPPDNNVEYTVYTADVTYTIEGLPLVNSENGLKITNEVRHNFGMVSLIEYPCNPDRIGAFEVVLPLLDAINLTESNRLDGIEQFIQALMVFDGVDITREDFLELKDLGAIKLPATQNASGGKKLYYLNEQLDQSQTQTLVGDMKQIILEIVGMPSQGNASTGDSSNNGAVIMRNGWWHAESRALQTQTMWKRAETEFLKIVLKICNETNTLTGLKISDLEPRFWRQSYEDLLVKTQSFSTLRTAGMPAIQAFKFSHLSRDPESDAIVYDDYQQMLADELDRLNGVSDDIPLNEDDTTDPTSKDGIEAQAAGESGDPGSGEKKGEWAICPVCGKRFQKKDPNQKYSSIACANKARRSTPRYGGGVG